MSAPTPRITQAARPSYPPRWPYVLVPVLFLFGALSGPAYYLYATSQPVIGANIGAGLGLMWTAGWGLPWSTVPWNATGATNQETFTAFTSCALLNAGLIAALFFLLYRRAARKQARHPTEAPQRWHYTLVPTILLLTVLAGPLYLWLSFYSGVSLPGENFGVVAGEYWSALLGMPWSVWAWGNPDLAFGYGLTLCALVNVGLASMGFWLAYRRALRRAACSWRGCCSA